MIINYARACKRNYISSKNYISLSLISLMTKKIKSIAPTVFIYTAKGEDISTRST